VRLGVAELALLLVFGPVLLAVLGWILLEVLKILKGPARGKAGGLNGTETQTIQEIHRGLARMEERIEALETILLEQHKGRTKGDE
jgi:phage shock protein B